MTTTNLTIRDAQLEEAPAVLHIWRVAFQSQETHGDLDDVQRVIFDDHTARLFLADFNGTLVGTLIVTFDGWRGNVYRLAVLPEHQLQCIARALVGVGEQWLHAVGCRKISALVERHNAFANA